MSCDNALLSWSLMKTTNICFCVHDGGYNVTSEILSFLSPAHLPVQITPTRWKSDKKA